MSGTQSIHDLQSRISHLESELQASLRQTRELQSERSELWQWVERHSVYGTCSPEVMTLRQALDAVYERKENQIDALKKAIKPTTELLKLLEWKLRNQGWITTADNILKEIARLEGLIR